MDSARLLDHGVFRYVPATSLGPHDYTTKQVMGEFEAFARRQTHYRDDKPGYALALVAADRLLLGLEGLFDLVDGRSNGKEESGIPEKVATKLLIAAGKRGGIHINYLNLKGEHKSELRHWAYVFKQQYERAVERLDLHVKTGSSYMRISSGDNEPRFTISLTQSNPAELFLQVLATYAQSSVESRLRFLKRRGMHGYFNALEESRRFQLYLPTGIWFVQHPEQALDYKTPPYFKALSDCFVKTLLTGVFEEHPGLYQEGDHETLKKILKSRHKRAFRKSGMDSSSPQVQRIMAFGWDLLEARLATLVPDGCSPTPLNLERINDKLGRASETDLNLVYTALEMPPKRVDVLTRDQDVKDGVIIANTYCAHLGSPVSSTQAELSSSASSDDLDALMAADERRQQLHGYFVRRRGKGKAIRWIDPYTESRRAVRPRSE